MIVYRNPSQARDSARYVSHVPDRHNKHHVQPDQIYNTTHVNKDECRSNNDFGCHGASGMYYSSVGRVQWLLCNAQ